MNGSKLCQSGLDYLEYLTNNFLNIQFRGHLNLFVVEFSCGTGEQLHLSIYIEIRDLEVMALQRNKPAIL